MLIKRLILESGLTEKQIALYATTASKRYYVFSIPKRNGEPRWIAHPARPIKALQRWLSSRLIRNWSVHSCATAYQKGSSIRSNALRHVNTNFTLRLDFVDFFPSFKRDGIEKFLKIKMSEDKSIDERDIKFFIDVVTRNGELTIGAPSSPLLTNAMMFEFDCDLSSLCERKGIIYTRYADDIFLSTREPGILQDVLPDVINIVSAFPYAKLLINSKKTMFLSKKNNRTITGLVITPDGYISLGRGRKREIKSLVHRFTTGDIESERVPFLKGLIAFCFDADRAFYNSLSEKYGARVMSKLLR